MRSVNLWMLFIASGACARPAKRRRRKRFARSRPDEGGGRPRLRPRLEDRTNAAEVRKLVLVASSTGHTSRWPETRSGGCDEPRGRPGPPGRNNAYGTPGAASRNDTAHGSNPVVVERLDLTTVVLGNQARHVRGEFRLDENSVRSSYGELLRFRNPGRTIRPCWVKASRRSSSLGAAAGDRSCGRPGRSGRSR
jgi:hypothetical protein